MSKNRGRPANTGVKNSSEPKFRDVDGLHPISKRFTGVFFAVTIEWGVYY